MATLAIYGGHHPRFATNATTTGSQSLMPPVPTAEDQYITTFFCRALYDYQTNDPSSLSFHRDDIIEVLTQLESGWWDGLLGDERGWFPSNYVMVISDEEAEAALASSESSLRKHEPHISHAMLQDGGISDHDQHWLEAEIDQASSQDGLLELANATMDSPSQPSDFWMPQVTVDGQIYYVNTQTGQHSRDLPQEVDDENPEGDLAGLTSQSSSRSGTSAGLGMGTSAFQRSESSQDISNTTLFRRAGTPEPWVKKLADDGMSYYYWNKLNGQIEWTRPETDATAVFDTAESETSFPSTRLPSESSMPTSQQPTSIVGGRLSAYSDDSDIRPLERERLTSSTQPPSDHYDDREYFLPRHATSEGFAAELTSAERLAQSLQESLAPPPPEVIVDLSDSARRAIIAVVENIQTTGFPRRVEEDLTMDGLVHGVVLAIRNLLYVSAAPSHIPSHVLPRGARDRTINPASQTLLKPAQRKVTATLSKLVLSARAMQYDSRSLENNTSNRIEGDAEELERAVVAFVLAAERCHNQENIECGRTSIKRLLGVFSTANIGMGLVGASTAGSWKGFGWVALDDDNEAPRRILGTEVVSELEAYLVKVEEQISALSISLRNPTGDSADQICARGQDAITLLSAFLSLLSNIHVARHVDIDGISQSPGQSPTSDLYAQTVDKARSLVRTLEAATQSLYDDGSALLLVIQSFQPSGISQQVQVGSLNENIKSLAAALRFNSKVVQKTLEELLSVGHDQADMAQGDYNGSIEWRMSRLSTIDNQIGGALRPTSKYLQKLNDSDGEDVVDIELAFRVPDFKNQDNGDISQDLGSSSDPQPKFEDRARSFDSVKRPPEPLDSSFDPTPDTDTGPLFDDEVPVSSARQAPRRGDKLRDILGEEAPQHYINTVNADLKPWYLRPNYSQTDILIDYPDGGVRGGTVPALVERLTAHEHGDPAFIKTFLMTYKSFTTLDELFDLLVQRFWIKPPPQLTSHELEEWTKLKQHVIQMRVLNTFKSMVVENDILEKEDMYILDRMKEFISNDEVIRFAAAKQLMISIERALRGTDAIKMMATGLQAPPPPIMPKTSKKLKLLDIDPLELARQLTIMESQLYQKIRPIECLQRSREQKAEHNDNIAAVIQTSNRIADWVAESVLSKEDSRRRAAAVKQFISVADRCRGLHNYSTMVAITSGLNTPPIRRLKRTWEQVNARFMAQLGACEMTIDSNKNFNNYRLTLASVTPPCVPFIGVFLTTLQFIQDGSKDNLSPNIVNFRKRQKASEVIQDIKRWQSQPFSFHPIPSVLAFIEESLNQFNDTVDIRDRFWNLSLEREPREREDEKMARLLQESGFL